MYAIVWILIKNCKLHNCRSQLETNFLHDIYMYLPTTTLLKASKLGYYCTYTNKLIETLTPIQLIMVWRWKYNQNYNCVSQLEDGKGILKNFQHHDVCYNGVQSQSSRP